MEEINWEEIGTGGTGSCLLGDGRCRENSATLILCSDIRGCCSDLVDTSTGVRDGLLVYALERSEISFQPLCLEETSTEGRCLEGTGTAVKDGSDFSDLLLLRSQISVVLGLCSEEKNTPMQDRKGGRTADSDVSELRKSEGSHIGVIWPLGRFSSRIPIVWGLEGRQVCVFVF